VNKDWRIITGHWSATIVLVAIFWLIFLQVFHNQIYAFVFGRLLVFLAVLPILFIVYWLMARPKAGEEIKVWWRNPIFLWLAGIFILAWATSWLGPNFFKSIWGAIERGSGLILWSGALGLLVFLLSSIRTSAGWRNLLTLVAVIAWLLAGYSLLQVIMPGSVVAGIRGAISSLFGNQVYSGIFISLTIPLLTYLVVSSKTWPAKLFWAIGVVLQLLALYWANTAGGAVGVMAGLACFGLLSVGLMQGWSAKKISLITIGLIGVATLAVSLPLWGGRSLAEVYLSHVSTISRLGFYKSAWEAIKHNPLGFGMENTQLAIQQYYHLSHDVVSFAETNSDRIHNIFLQTGVDGGWLAIAGLLAAIVAIARRGLKAAWQADLPCNEQLLILAVLSGLFGYLVVLQTVFHIVPTVIIGTVFIGYIIHTTSGHLAASKDNRIPAILMAVGAVVFSFVAVRNIIPSFAPSGLADKALQQTQAGQLEQAYQTIKEIKPYQGKTPYYYGLIRRYSSISKDYAITLGEDNPQYVPLLLDGLGVLDQLEKFNNRDYILLDRPTVYAYLIAADRAKYMPLYLDTLDAIKSWNPHNPYVQLAGARMLMSAGLFPEAEAEFNKLTALANPPRGTYLWQASLSLFQGKLAPEVIKLVEKAASRNELVIANTGDMPYQIVHELVKILSDNQRWDLVLGLQKNLILTSRSEVAEEWINLAVAYQKNNLLDEAVDAARHSVKLDPKLKSAASQFVAQFGRSL
jgi:tetratricopeptide (TPR) repeat protein